MSRTFYIVDGHAQIFRAYFAPFRQLTSPTGLPTKAIYVFTQMLLNLAEQRRPDYLAMVIDSGDEQVFRKQIYPGYKANRPPIPEDFPPQEQRILRIVRDAGVPLYAMPGFEADDLIATFVRRLRNADFQVFIVSRDKDLRQLVGENVRMYDVQEDRVIDAQTIAEKFGYTPAQAVDVQTLCGDLTDNVPGIPGVGEKTAAKLVNKYGSADAVLRHASEQTPALRKNLQLHADRLDIARQLVRLREDVPIEFDPESCRFTGFRIEGLRPHLRELGFTSLLERLGSHAAMTPILTSSVSPKPADGGVAATRESFAESLFGEPHEPVHAAPLATAEGCSYTLVNTPAKLSAFLADLRRQNRFAFDTETDALGAMRSSLVGMSFSWQAGRGFYLPVAGPAGEPVLQRQPTLDALRPVLEDASVQKVGHNIKYDLLVMREAGVDLRGIALDTMIAAFLLDAGRNRFGIDDLARDLLGFQKIPTSELIGKGREQISMDRVPLDRIAVYASEDADIAWRLSELLGRRLDQQPALRKLNDELETPLIEVLAEIERNGVAIDANILRQQSRALGQRIEALRSQLHEMAGGEFNLDSTRQLADVLFKRLGLRSVKRTKTGHSTDVEVLEKLATEHRFPRLVLEYRGLVKLKNTYLDTLTDYVNPRTGRIHASFNQIGAATGRLSCSDPNLQNIPVRSDEGRQIRLAFVPGDRQRDVLLTADYSQVELRMLAHFTQEPALLAAFAADEDIHAAVAAEVFGVPLGQVTKAQRGEAKTINFGIIYGVSAFGLARRIEGMTVQAAEALIAAYNKRFPSIHRFLQQCVAEAQSRGYVQTILGRRRPLPDINSPVATVRNGAERMAINSVVQGSAADLIKLAMVNVHRRLKRENRPSRMLMQVHDELVFETPAESVEQEANVIRHEMVHAGVDLELKVPLKVDVGWGANWQEGK